MIKTPKLSLMRALFLTQVRKSEVLMFIRSMYQGLLFQNICIVYVTGVVEACVQDVQLHSQFFPDHRYRQACKYKSYNIFL